jgi:tetratricopeptide (TPR) repeat protein
MMAVLALAVPAADEATAIEGMLGGGRFRAVAQMMHDRLEEAPDDTYARAYLGQALAGLGRCYHARPALEKARMGPGWSAGAAISEAVCAERRGEYTLAVAILEEAVILDPEHPRAWYWLARSAAHSGDTATMDRALEAIWTDDRAPNMYSLAQAWIAFEHGGDVPLALADVDDSLEAHPRDAATAERGIIEAREWLRLGAPVLAVEALEQSWRGRSTDVRLHGWLAESLRRSGEADRAAALWQGNLLSRSQLPEVRILRARWAVDAGDFEEARRLLDLTEGEERSLWLLTRWYLARAEGQSEDGWRLAFEGVRGVSDVEPEALIPL